MNQGTTYVGMDVHKKDIAVCLLSVGGEVSEEWTVAHTKPSPAAAGTKKEASSPCPSSSTRRAEMEWTSME